MLSKNVSNKLNRVFETSLLDFNLHGFPLKIAQIFKPWEVTSHAEDKEVDGPGHGGHDETGHNGRVDTEVEVVLAQLNLVLDIGALVDTASAPVIKAFVS